MEKIDLSAGNCSSTSLVALLKAAPNLRSIVLEQYQTSRDAIRLDEGCLLKLESINLAGSNISNDGIVTILKAAPNLKYIDFSECNHLALEKLLAEGWFKKLEKINLSFSELSADTILALVKASPRLKEISVKYCQHVTPQLLEELKIVVPHLHIEHRLDDFSTEKTIATNGSRSLVEIEDKEFAEVS